MKNLYIILAVTACISSVSAQKGKPAKDWYQQKENKKNMGVNSGSTYEKLLKNKQAKEIIVAVIDGGTDISHPDLKANIWHNPGEIPFNNIDDDHNGYVDDTVGWNFIGNANGECVEFDNLEKTRIVKSMQAEFEDLDAEDVANDPSKKARYEYYKKLRDEIASEKESNEKNYKSYEKFQESLDNIAKFTGKDDPTMAEIEKFEGTAMFDARVKAIVLQQMKNGATFKGFYSELKEGLDHFVAAFKYQYNTEFDGRAIVGDHYLNSGERYYGNSNVTGPDAHHGTHVAGIIAAVRNNGLGMDGIADHAKIMVVRVVPNGDERDKDVANGIRYATDNGAKIINMSFGKSFKWNKNVVDSAVAYAVSKGVILVHAAGNDNSDNDIVPNYPNDSLGNGNFASTWIEVGASAPPLKNLAASFSNFGKNNVDVFAPGYQIYSTVPGASYAYYDGTSMAAPVTSGVLALVWSYYPTLTASQMKNILMKSVVVNKKKVDKPGGGKAKFNSLCVSGGVINAYRALKMAEKTAH